jgi:hypothetical protein
MAIVGHIAPSLALGAWIRACVSTPIVVRGSVGPTGVYAPSPNVRFALGGRVRRNYPQVVRRGGARTAAIGRGKARVLIVGWGGILP